MSEDWDPPTQAPAIKHTVLILQNGRSFDSYFGQYCRGDATAGGGPSPCEDGADCCERMPAVPVCAPLDPGTDTHVPIATPECLRRKIDDGAMDGFSAVSSSSPCGDPLDAACAGVGSAAGAVDAYHQLAGEGALADRFFQTYAYADGDGAASAPDPVIENLLYLTTARFADPAMLRDTPLLTKELARVEVPWAIYGGKTTSRA